VERSPWRCPRRLPESSAVLWRIIPSNDEEYLFTRFEKARKQTGLVKALNQQYQAGRQLTGAFRALLSPEEFLDLGEKFEVQEEKLFGKEGLEKVVPRVATWRNGWELSISPHLRLSFEGPGPMITGVRPGRIRFQAGRPLSG
jgi:hypothetical protein